MEQPSKKAQTGQFARIGPGEPPSFQTQVKAPHGKVERCGQGFRERGLPGAVGSQERNADPAPGHDLGELRGHERGAMLKRAHSGRGIESIPSGGERLRHGFDLIPASRSGGGKNARRAFWLSNAIHESCDLSIRPRRRRQLRERGTMALAKPSLVHQCMKQGDPEAIVPAWHRNSADALASLENARRRRNSKTEVAPERDFGHRVDVQPKIGFSIPRQEEILRPAAPDSNRCESSMGESPASLPRIIRVQEKIDVPGRRAKIFAPAQETPARARFVQGFESRGKPGMNVVHCVAGLRILRQKNQNAKASAPPIGGIQNTTDLENGKRSGSGKISAPTRYH